MSTATSTTDAGGPARAPEVHARDVRVTVRPQEDVLLPAGRRLGELRRDLARVLARPELHHDALVALGDAAVPPTPLADDQVVGVHPLVPGATLTTCPRPAAPPGPADGSGVLAAAWHVAVVAGPDAGHLLAVPARRTTLVHGIRVRAGRRTVRVLDTGRARWVRGDRGRSRRAAPGSRWRPGRELLVDGAVLRLRVRPDVQAWGLPGRAADAADAAGPDRAGGGGTAPVHASAPAGPGVSTLLTTALVPAAGSAALAVALGHPLLLLVALVGPLVLLGPRAARGLRRRRESDTGARPAAPSPGRDGTAPLAEPADLLLTALASAHGAASPPGAPRPPGARVPARVAGALPDRSVAVLGPHARGVARALVAGLVCEGAHVVCAGSAALGWAWLRWVGGRRARGVPPAADPATVLVVDDDDDLARSSALVRWREARPGATLVVVARRPDQVPAWCRTVVGTGDPVHAGTVHAGTVPTGTVPTGTVPTGTVPTVSWTLPGGRRATGRLGAVSAAWAESFARSLAGASAAGRGPAVLLAGPAVVAGTPGDDAAAAEPADPRIPRQVCLADVLDAPDHPDAGWVRARWALARDERGLTVPLGRTAAGLLTLDLAAGPHALVAGTTGAGKSALLRSLVLGLALRYPPDRLALALVDFKGGTGFGRCATLPHVVGTVTDLDPGSAARAITGIRTELTRRERVVARHGATHLDELPPGTLPRLVVVIDEFRALAEDLPDLLPSLLRLAAQGRALGMHLVLATQRPAGAVNAEIRANVPLRIALRTVDRADSSDVVGVPDAARISPSTPGRAVARTDDAAAVAFQCALVDGPRRRARPGVRRAPGWAARAPGDLTADPDTLRDAPRGDLDLVALVRDAAPRPGAAPPARPLWAPPLPGALDLRALAAHPRDADDLPPGTVPLALGDRPAQQRHVVLGWRPGSGPLGILGRPRSGRTTALASLAHGLLAAGHHVHAVAGPGLRSLLPVSPGLGTVLPPDDVARLARLVDLLLATGGQGPRPVLLVDDLPVLLEQLATVPGGPELVDALLRAGTPLAVTGTASALQRWVPALGARLVLGSADRHDDVAAGIPAALAGQGGPPGRGVWISRAEDVPATACQVARPGPGPGPGPVPGARRGAGAPPAPTRLAAVPERVEAGALPRDGRGLADRVVLGLGGDAAGPVTLDVAAGAVVVGAPGSGRTTALGVVAAALARDGRLLGIVGDLPGPRWPDAASDRAPAVVTGVLVVDDLDLLALRDPDGAERVAALVRQGVGVVAGTTPAAVLGAHRGALAELRAARRALVLGPPERGLLEVLGARPTPASAVVPRRPGRGVLLDRGSVTHLQVATSPP
ncbi:FtsK/SpoIIIE domain-containing protein [Cellulomonas sp. PhB143]|uniref:FtsK/SpoIIIE domain-containing protein n=1 Tax=Cellulomonas sp. PhB143 TaxID=2485186 RepID=UPI000F491A65|nr:FtsK/SpoIIIE domain-containing protein [Cellulomonas sp. PhB143]ROS78589.1 S-DNA-T family DNA segregation ATPase FtsK/SpoIIIE [Cellulomonas sp. PhB143]